MYTEVKSYQYVIALLKKYNIKHCVLSAGSRNLPFVHSVEEDSFFRCYSVVDERSAGYFALGLAQELNEPVVISCTSSTATCNYWPPVAEAFYQKVPLIILTSDRDPEMLGQWEDQMINQVGMYDRHVRKSVNLPIIENYNDEIYCQRLINEAFFELNHNGATGPIHINVPTNTYNRSFIVKELPEVKKIDRISINESEDVWESLKNKLKKSNKVLLICGQKNYVSDELNKQINIFASKYNAVVISDYMSNINCETAINPSIIMDTQFANKSDVKKVLPDIVITYGGQIFSGIKAQLLNNNGKYEHWSIEEDGNIVDCFKSLNKVFECKPEEFFDKINQNMTNTNNNEYHKLFEELINDIVYPEFEWSHVYAIKNVVENIPENSILHLSINDSIRITNFFKLRQNIKTYANIGTHGIDGCMSSFIGQSCVDSKKLSYLVIGDLAFFYDMNSLRIHGIGNNVRILLINNHGGSEFYYNSIYQGNDKHTTARHNTKAEGWIRENNFKYLCAHNKDEYNKNLKEFMCNESSQPIVFEVFTEMKTDADVIHNFYNKTRHKSVKNEIVRAGKEFAKKTLGQERAKKILYKIKK